MKYVIYALVGLLVLWSAGYLIYDFHRRLKGRRGCGSGGCESCPHKGAGVFCGKRGAVRQSRAFRGGNNPPEAPQLSGGGSRAKAPLVKGGRAAEGGGGIHKRVRHK